MAEEFECEKCGRKFDTKRGLSSHQAQSHQDEESSEESSDSGGSGSQMINISVRHALAGVFVLGLAVGLSAGMMLGGGGQSLVGDIPTDTSDTADPSDSEGSASAGDIGYVDNSKVSGSTPNEVFASIANNLGMDGEQLTSCIQETSGSEISGDRTEITNKLDSVGTPTFLIGNSEIGYERINGAMPYSRMKATIDEQISEAENPGSDTIEDDEHELSGIGFENEQTLGDESAAVNMIEYSDYACPWCAEWHGVNAVPQRPIDEEESFSKVRSNYIENGDMFYVLKDFPAHGNSMPAHKAAKCAYKQNQEKFWKFSAELYDNREKW